MSFNPEKKAENRQITKLIVKYGKRKNAKRKDMEEDMVNDSKTISLFKEDFVPRKIYLHVDSIASVQMSQYAEALTGYVHTVEFNKLPKEKRDRISVERKLALEWIKTRNKTA